MQIFRPRRKIYFSEGENDQTNNNNKRTPGTNIINLTIINMYESLMLFNKIKYK